VELNYDEMQPIRQAKKKNFPNLQGTQTVN